MDKRTVCVFVYYNVICLFFKCITRVQIAIIYQPFK